MELENEDIWGITLCTHSMFSFASTLIWFVSDGFRSVVAIFLSNLGSCEWTCNVSAGPAIEVLSYIDKVYCVGWGTYVIVWDSNLLCLIKFSALDWILLVNEELRLIVVSVTRKSEWSYLLFKSFSGTIYMLGTCTIDRACFGLESLVLRALF